MKSFPASFDFEKYKEASKSQFPVFILTCALVFTALVFFWLWRQVERPEPGIVLSLGLSALIWTIVIYSLFKARKNLLLGNLQRERAEMALLGSEAHFREMFENASDLVYTTDIEGNFRSLNKRGEHLTGYTAEEFCRLNFVDVVAPEYLEGLRQSLCATLKGKDYTTLRLEIVRKDGGRISLEVSNRLVCDNDAPVGVQGIARDIGERQRLEESLRASEAQYRAFIERSSEGIWRFDLSQPISSSLSVEEQVELTLRYGYLAECNDAMAQMYGLNRAEELQGKRLHDLFVLSDAANYEFLSAFIGSNYRLTDAESHEVDAKGNDKYFLNNLIGIVKNGNLVGAWGTQRDITPRRRAAELLRASEERLRTVINSAPVILFAADTEGIVTMSEGSGLKSLGLKPGQKVGTSIFEDYAALELVESTGSRTAFGQLVGRVLSGESINGFTQTNGIFYDSRFTPQRDEYGKVVGLTALSIDVTDRRRAEEAFKRAVGALDAASDGVFMFREDTLQLFFVNEGAIKLTGFSREELLEMSALDLKPELEEKFIRRVLDSLIKKTRSSYTLTSSHRRRDGTLVPVEIILQYDAGGQGENVFVAMVRDVTERARTEAALRESRYRYEQLFECNPYPIWVYELETLRFLAVNPAAVRHYGYSREEFLQMTLADIRPPEDLDLMRKNCEQAAIKGGHLKQTVRHLKRDGSLIDVEIASQPVDFTGKNARLVIITDVTERERATEALRESEYKLRGLLESMNEGLVQVDGQQVIQFVNDRFCEMTGYCHEELVGKTNFDVFLDDEGRQMVAAANEERLKGLSGHYEVRLKKKNGELLWMIVGGAPIINAEGAIVGTMGVFTDITERKRAEDRLLHDAFYDNLTGLANRTLFIDHLQMAIARGHRDKESLYSVLFLDFDRFKVINDSLGHAEGDRLLQQIARRLENSVRNCDLVARLGGDEFTILLTDLADASDATLVAERIQEDLKAPFDLGAGEMFMSASIGITLSSVGHHSAEEMLRDADIAMYRAKAKGKAQYQVFDREMHAHAMSQLQLETELRRALQSEEFYLEFQPIMNLETEAVVGFEALIRWCHPQRGVVSPGEFIGAAEENGLILPIGWWILGEACRRMREWQTENPLAEQLSISVNLSSKQFLQFDLADRVAETLAATGLDPRCLKLEITESHVMENSDMAVTMMNRLRALGVELSLDDFGTGYSSLSYLHRLPVSTLKIDRTFVTRMTESRENGEIVFTVIKLAQNLKMQVIAEGVESREQFERLREIGCENGQGYFFSKPLDAEDARLFIKERVNPTVVPPKTPLSDLEGMQV